MRERREDGARSDTDPRRRAAEDAEVLARLLTGQQRRLYAGSRDRRLAAQRLEAERYQVLVGAPPPHDMERTEAEAALAGDTRIRSVTGHQDRAHRAGMIAGAVFLVAGGLGMLLGSDVLVAIGVLALAVSALLLGVDLLWRRRLAAHRVHVLVEWASRRPGQLGRGLPLSTRTARWSLWQSELARKLMTIAGALGLVLLGVTVRQLLAGDGSATGGVDLVFGGALCTVSLIYFVAGPFAHRRAQRRDSALSWLPSSTSTGRARHGG